jgi:ABC-type dipeptide/oligopeptide/nickel transport system permease component
MYEGYHAKKGGIRSLGTLVFFSIPDVLIVLLGVISYTFIAKNFAYIKDSLPLKEFIFPLITLSIIPTVYISRITYLTILEELNKEYVRAAKALGYSKIKIFRTEILPAVIFKVVDSLPTIMTMLLSNMIIVEYLFNYNGIVYYLLYLYKRQDVYRFVPMALTLGLIYSGFVYGIGQITKIINPLKRGARR